VSAKLRGKYSVTRDDRIDLEFEDIKLSIGPFQAAQKVGWCVCVVGGGGGCKPL
jgi:hypothetical protein